MTLEINTNTEAELQKLNEYLVKCEEVEEKTKKIHFVTIKEFAEMRGCSIKIAQDIFNLPDFPNEDFGKEKVVSIEALRNFYMQKHKKSDYD